MEEIKWNEKYNVGVDYVDAAHKKLFSILRHILNFEQLDDEKVKWTCQETIVYLKNYTIQHFQQEEEYMKSVQYGGYETHKRLHDNLREVTLPQLEKELVENDFSKESVYHLVAVLSGWLTGHIVIEDRAITGAMNSRYSNLISGNLSEKVSREIGILMNEVYHLGIEVKNGHYEGEPIPDSKGFEYIYSYGEKTGSVFFVANMRMILKMVSIIMGKEITVFDKEAATACIQFQITVGKAILSLCQPEEELEFKTARPFSVDSFPVTFGTHFPIYSTLWRGAEGQIGIIVDTEAS